MVPIKIMTDAHVNYIIHKCNLKTKVISVRFFYFQLQIIIFQQGDNGRN